MTNDGVTFGPIAASTAAFELQGGLYQVSVLATFGGGSVKFEQLGPDGTTFVEVDSTTSFTAAGHANVYIPPGQYKFVVATATAVYAQVSRIPL